VHKIRKYSIDVDMLERVLSVEPSESEMVDMPNMPELLICLLFHVRKASCRFCFPQVGLVSNSAGKKGTIDWKS
jgi:hypothetical protein